MKGWEHLKDLSNDAYRVGERVVKFIDKAEHESNKNMERQFARSHGPKPEGITSRKKMRPPMGGKR
jgi:hypothetical protein